MYIYETHLHTSPSSRCASASPEEQVNYYLSKNYTGICITDHFIVGKQEEKWEDTVNNATAGFEKAKLYAKDKGISVFFGYEYTNCTHPGLDILTYGLDKNFLLSNPQIADMNINEYCDFARKNNGILIHAHPFREAFYIPMIRLLPRKVDAVEIKNANRTDFENALALQYAQNYQLPVCAGSDNHTADKQEKLCGIKSNEKYESVIQLARSVVDGKVEIF